MYGKLTRRIVELEKEVEELKNGLHDADNLNGKLIKQLTELRELYFPICDIKALLENGHIESAIDMLEDIEQQLAKEV